MAGTGEGGAQNDSIRRWSVLICAGILATTLSQTYVLDLPIRRLLADDLRESQQSVALFFALVGIAWYLKPIAGLLSDYLPLFGTRRRHYLIWSALLAGAFWLLAGWVPRAYLPILLASIAMNAMLVIGSTVTGALLAEAGQRLDAAGRLSAARVVVDEGCAVIGGPLAGLLASLPFEMAAITGAAIACVVVPIAWLWLREPARSVAAFGEGWDRFKHVLRARELWIAALFLFVIAIPQAFQTSLYFFQTRELGLTVETVGYLKGVWGAGSVLAAALYGVICRRLSLRQLLALGILCAAAGVLSHLFYRSLTLAVLIAAADGFLAGLCTLALMQVSVWSVPMAGPAVGFSVLMSTWNAGDAVGDMLAAALVERWSFGFFGMIGCYGVGLLAMLALLPVLPRAVLERREGAKSRYRPPPR